MCSEGYRLQTAQLDFFSESCTILISRLVSHFSVKVDSSSIISLRAKQAVFSSIFRQHLLESSNQSLSCAAASELFHYANRQQVS